MIHTAGTVVSSPASLTLAAVWSDTAAVDALLGAASCGQEKPRCQHPAVRGPINCLDHPNNPTMFL